MKSIPTILTVLLVVFHLPEAAAQEEKMWLLQHDELENLKLYQQGDDYKLFLNDNSWLEADKVSTVGARTKLKFNEVYTKEQSLKVVLKANDINEVKATFREEGKAAISLEGYDYLFYCAVHDHGCAASSTAECPDTSANCEWEFETLNLE